MRVIVLTIFEKFNKEFEMDVIPRIGDRIDVGYSPTPIIKEVIWQPDKNTVILSCA